MATPIRFEQDPESPEGAGLFEFDDGQSMFAYEPQLASALAPRTGPDERLAQAPVRDAEGEQMARDFVAGKPVSAPPLVAQNAHSSGPKDAFEANMGPMPAERPKAPAQPSAQPQEGMVPLFSTDAPQRAPQGPSAQAPMVHQQARRGGYTPSAQTITTEAGPEYRPEDAELRGMANDGVVRAQMAQYDAQAAQAEHQAQSLRTQIPVLMKQEMDAQRELREREQRYKEERARAQVYVEAAESRKIDPERFYKEKSTAGNISLVIGQMLGAFGAALSQSPNVAFQILQSSLDRDMAAQEEEIKSGRVSANNMLARISEDMGGDVEQAKATLRMSQLASVDAQIKEQAAWGQSAEVQRAADLWLAQNQQARVAEEQKFMALSQGKTTTTAALKYQPGQSGGSRQMSPEEEAKYWKAKAEGKKYRDQYEGNSLDEADAKAVERYARRREGPENMIGQISDIASLAGGKIVNGKVQLGDDVPGVGPIASRLPDLLLSNKGRHIRQSIGNMAADVIKDKSGAAVTDSERALLMKIVEGGTKTEAELRNGLQIIHNYANRKQRNIDAAFPGAVRGTYRKQGADAVREGYAEDEADVETY